MRRGDASLSQHLCKTRNTKGLYSYPSSLDINFTTMEGRLVLFMCMYKYILFAVMGMDVHLWWYRQCCPKTVYWDTTNRYGFYFSTSRRHYVERFLILLMWDARYEYLLWTFQFFCHCRRVFWSKSLRWREWYLSQGTTGITWRFIMWLYSWVVMNISKATDRSEDVALKWRVLPTALCLNGHCHFWYVFGITLSIRTQPTYVLSLCTVDPGIRPQ